MIQSSRKLFYHFPWGLLGMLLLLLGLGLANLYSATTVVSGETFPYFKSQAIYLGAGLVLLALLQVFHFRRLEALVWPLFWASVTLLVAVIFFGTVSGGQKNWLVWGPLRLQPSELSKLALVGVLAWFFQRAQENPTRTWYRRTGPLLAVALPTLLVLVERDLGSAVFFILLGLSYFFLIGIPWRYVLALLLVMTLSGAVAYRYFLSPYQRGRIQTFLNPEKDPKGKGYHLMQSKIAVGSGRMFGKGYLEGSLNKLKFLPERHTDFIFPVLAEEWGLAGSAAALSAFLFFLLLLLHLAGKVRDPFGAFWIAGVAVLLFWQAAINLGGVLGLMPLAGVTLPFFSYGGSALAVDLIAVGVALNIGARRYVF